LKPSRESSENLTRGTDEVAAALAGGDIRYGILAGAASPITWGQSARATADLSPNPLLRVVSHAGHFVWHEAPGSVRVALEALQESV
jgi:pimeloyl-ACP methyl ester carboxylesterase